MPIYEYRCQECGTRSTFLILNLRSAATPACPHCQSQKLDRLFSRFASPKSEEAHLEALTDPSRYGDFDENDPQSMERLMKKVGEDMGEDLPADLHEMGGGKEESSGEFPAGDTDAPM
jgi:putative FmdB family regulatory protein